MRRTASLRARSKYKPVAVERFHDFVADEGCLVCGGPAEVHHVTGYAHTMGRVTRDDWMVTPLCPLHHRGVGESSRMLVSVQSLNHRGFYQEHGIDLYAEAQRLAEKWMAQ
jgi:hypothetical protein